MTEFESIVSNLLHPNGDGSWTAPPCKQCGCSTVLLLDTPACLDCSGREALAGEVVERLVLLVDELAELVPMLPAPVKVAVNGDVEFLLLALSKIVVATGGRL